MTPEQATMLRAPFPDGVVGKLPKPYKKDSPKGRCNECGGYHGLPAVHLDYVGHAATTDRLLQVDPEWTWEPVAIGPGGEPLMTNGGMWIRLTVAGVTRYGFGDGASVKEVIGDAIRNAAMRFGVALDLWAKEDLQAAHQDSGLEPSGVAAPDPPVADAQTSPGAASASSPDAISPDQIKRLHTIATRHKVPKDEAKRLVKEWGGVDSSKLLPRDRYDAVVAALEAWTAPETSFAEQIPVGARGDV